MNANTNTTSTRAAEIAAATPAHERRSLAVGFLTSGKPLGDLLISANGTTPAAFVSAKTLFSVLVMARLDAPDDLRVSDPALHKRLRERITDIRLGGWAGALQ